MSSTSDSTSTNDIELTVNRALDAPRDLVFRAWTEPARLKQWWSPVLEADIRPGGAWRAEVRNPDGSGSWSHGEYREIVAPERIVYTFAWDATDSAETVITVTLADDGGKTNLTAQQGPFATQEDRDNHAEGWNVALDELAAYLSSAGGEA
ncbi:MAG: SRPBCC domain-containing protein [Chloroflexota bacterium]|nr:SRPBCC domain-containing protein [Chloroflexota bacterium]